MELAGWDEPWSGVLMQPQPEGPERSACAYLLDAELDRNVGRDRTEEVAVQRVRRVGRLGGAHDGRCCHRQHLTTERAVPERARRNAFVVVGRDLRQLHAADDGPGQRLKRG